MLTRFCRGPNLGNLDKRLTNSLFVFTHQLSRYLPGPVSLSRNGVFVSALHRPCALPPATTALQIHLNSFAYLWLAKRSSEPPQRTCIKPFEVFWSFSLGLPTDLVLFSCWDIWNNYLTTGISDTILRSSTPSPCPP